MTAEHVRPDGGLTEAQVAAYLERIGVPRPGGPSPEGLAVLQRAHLAAVPFENLSVHLGEPIVLEPGALVEKIVGRHRGGFCYELNGAFGELLRALGYRVTLLAARVFGGGRLGPPFDHMALRVDLDGGAWLADVGFGRFSELPLRLDRRGEQVDPGGVFTVVEHGDELDVRQDGEPQYRLDQRPYQLADFGPTCWWQATSPESHFRRSTTCSLLTADGRITLSGTRLIRTAVDGTRTEQQLDQDGTLAAYRTHFGIVLEQLPGAQD
ncbi:arylamine N-acetyltransferase [Kitasatospora sp. NPDC002040]|uniref:arylamine N-acetyltransferase family protein n=1 Tax=Kitasatospora sp. NPDC002040 TaxID=3154661 RepID=UPI00331FEE07